MSKLETIKITKINEVFIHISADRGILKEISDRFTFEVNNYKFTPAYKNGGWDGKIRVFDYKNNLIYAGLLDEIKQFALENDYDIVMDYEDFAENELSRIEAIDFIKKIISEVNIPDFEQEIREYQLVSFMSMVRHSRRLLLSPTSSGKSFLIYLLIRYYKLPTLIIVDSTAAVRQMASDLVSYGYSTEDIHMIYSGQEKNLVKPVVISTWQSVSGLKSEYLNEFGVLLGDECLHPDTLITMGDDTKKKISDIVIGDTVKTFNEKSKEIENKPVVKVHKNISIKEKMLEIKVSNGNSIRITGNHKVLLTNGNWKRADELIKGDIINTY